MRTVGVLGGGQLGRMLALAGYPLGLRFRFLDPAADAPAGQVAELLRGDYHDAAVLEHFARGARRGHLRVRERPGRIGPAHRERPCPSTRRRRPWRPARIALPRRRFSASLGLPTAPFAPVDTRADLDARTGRLGLPAILKTRRFGYDGKGQIVLRDADRRCTALGRNWAACR